MGDEALLLPTAALGIDRSERLRKRGLGGLAASSALLVVLSAMTIAVDSGALCAVGLVPLLGVGASLLTLAASAARTRPKLRAGVISLAAGELTVRIEPDGAGLVEDLRVPLSDVTQGWWEEPNLVHLATRSGEVLVLRALDAGEGETLLRAAGVAAAERVLRVPLASAASRFTGMQAFAALALALTFLAVTFGAMVMAIGVRDVLLNGPTLRALRGFGASSLVLAPLLALGSALVRGLRRREATVGSDGILYRKTFRAQFIPYASVVDAVPDRRGVRVVRREGKPIVLPMSGADEVPLPTRAREPGHVPMSEEEARRDALVERIRLGLTAHREGARPAPSLERLDRRGRSLPEWREELAKLLASDETGYRRTGLTAAELGGVIEDAAAPAERRVAAAVALSAREQGEARRRVRIATQACADEDLRRALEAAAEGELEEEVGARRLLR